MALMDTRIPLAGQPPEIMNALSRGALAGQQQNQIQQQNALTQLYQTQGPGIAAGETDALNALAALSPEMALGIQDSRQVMAARDLGMQQTQLQMELAREQARVAAEQHVATMSAQEAAAEAARIGQAVQSAYAMSDTPEGWAQALAMNGLDPAQYPFEQKDMFLAQVLGLEDALKARAAMGPDETARLIVGQEAAAMGLPDGAYNLLPDGRVQAIGTPSTNINLPGAPEIGTIPPGYEVFLNPETGQREMRQIPGGPVEAEAQAAADARSRQEDLTARQLNPTIDDIETARDLATHGIGTTGMMSNFIARVPGLGQSAVDLQGTIEAIEAGISLENLNQMRQASPTGGALGNVSDKQSALLAGAFGLLQNTQSRELFLYNLARVENTLNDIVHGLGEGPPRHDMQALRRDLRIAQGIETEEPSRSEYMSAFEDAPDQEAAPQGETSAPTPSPGGPPASSYRFPEPALIAQMAKQDIEAMASEAGSADTWPQEVYDAVIARLAEIEAARGAQ
jgi:hypothetical protein